MIFHTKLKEGEKEFVSQSDEYDTVMGEDEAINSSQNQVAEDSDSDMAADDDDESGEDPSALIKIINPSSPQERVVFSGISNLAALRMMNDVDIRPAPSPPVGSKPVTPPNRLIDQGGWQEIYSGMNIWIYDAQSNFDQCVRVVSQQGDVYGTAT